MIDHSGSLYMPANQLPSSIKFHYIKGNFFRVVHVDGAIGGLTPSRDIFVSLFSQRAPIPQMIELTVSPEGNLGSELKRETKEGVVREMEVGLALSAKAARDLGNFLLEQAKLYEESSPALREESMSSEKAK
jgi:hypothetical protein